MTTISNEYAVALFELSAEQDQLQENLVGLDLVQALLADQPAYRALLASPAIGRQKRIDALEQAFRGRITDPLLGVLRMMVSRGETGLLDKMAREYEALVKEAQGETVALVTSATALTDAQRQALRQKLEKKFSRKVDLRCRVNPALLGGLRVEIEGRVIDGSLRNRLEQIKEVMHA